MSNLFAKVPLRDVVHIATVLVAVSGAYFGLSAKMDYLVGRVERMDDRLWELQGRSQTALLPLSCPADATYVAMLAP